MMKRFDGPAPKTLIIQPGGPDSASGSDRVASVTRGRFLSRIVFRLVHAAVNQGGPLTFVVLDFS
jgi:hypothetical protein